MTAEEAVLHAALPPANAAVDTGFGVSVPSYAVGSPPAGILSVDAVRLYAPCGAFEARSPVPYFGAVQSDLFADQAQEAVRRAQESEQLAAYWEKAAEFARQLGVRPNRSRTGDFSEEPPVLYSY
jgi:hypothetical protein